MKRSRLAILAFIAAIAAAIAFAAPTKESPSAGHAPTASDYVGTKLCLACHIKFAKKWPELPHSKALMDEPPSQDLKSRAGKARGCEACHGPGRKHATTDRRAIIRFAELTPGQKDDICLDCHVPKVTAVNWRKSAHARQQLSCTLCHDMHNPAVPVKMLRKGFDVGCRCHDAVREKAANGKHHRLPEGFSCTSCHTPHGSVEPSGLIKPKAELCKDCHGEKGAAPASHQAADWKKTHGKAEDRSSCETCHGKENTCTKCHGGVEMPHPSGWMMEHKGKGASFEAGASCFRCHDKKEFCGRCHADKV